MFIFDYTFDGVVFTSELNTNPSTGNQEITITSESTKCARIVIDHDNQRIYAKHYINNGIQHSLVDYHHYHESFSTLIEYIVIDWTARMM